MKKLSIVTIGVTGALILTTAATVLAAPSANKEQTENDTQTILSSSTAKSAPTELPERLRNSELPEGITLPDNKEDTGVKDSLTLPEKPEGEDMKPFVERSKFKSQFTPKQKPETKPEEDMVPPEFEGIEKIDQLGRPEFSEEEMPEDMPEDMRGERGESAHERQFGNEMPEGMPEDMRGGRGESSHDRQFGNEMPNDMAEDMPEDMHGGRGGSADGMQAGNEPAL